MTSTELAGHAGQLAVAVAQAHGVETMFTLSGAHVFPMYDGAVKAAEEGRPMRLLDVRHEQTAAFAAEATGKLTRVPGLAVLTAGPGVTNGISAMAQAQFAGSPMVVVGGRAPNNRWGTGALQEIDHLPIVGPVTKHAATLMTADDVAAGFHEAFTAARSPHRGPAYVDVPMDEFFNQGTGPVSVVRAGRGAEPDSDAIDRIAALLAAAARPLLILGTDVWADGAEAGRAAVRRVDRRPDHHQRDGARRDPRRPPAAGDEGARAAAIGGADLVVVVGTPLDFRLGYGDLRRQGWRDTCAGRPHRRLPRPGLGARRPRRIGGRRPDRGVRRSAGRARAPAAGPTGRAGSSVLQDTVSAAAARDAELLSAEADPVHPARIYGELVPRLADDAVVIGDGGDFVSFAGKYVEPKRPGCWLDPGPYGCLGAGLGAAIAARVARPSSQVVLLLGDGAAGFSLMDVDTLVRHNLPVVMVMGNNSAWGLEKGPMQMLYGYDVAADLAPRTAYDSVVKALGGAGETVTDPQQIGPALDRAFAAGAPYLVNVITDVNAAYPRSTLGIRGV